MDMSGHAVFSLVSGQWYFHTGHTATLLGVSKKTIYRWRKNGLIEYRQDQMNKRYLFSLDEINRIRRNKVLDKLSVDDALSIIKKEMDRK